MKKKFQQTWDQVTLSPQADAGIRGTLEAAAEEHATSLRAENADRKNTRRFRRIAIIAAVIACLLTVTALAASLYHVEFRPRYTKLYTNGNYFEDENGFLEVFFEKTSDEPVELQAWGISAILEGFEKVETFDYDNEGVWRNADGEEFRFWYEEPKDPNNPDGHARFDPKRIQNQYETSVNGNPAFVLVYTNSSDRTHTNLWWTIPDAGIGFCIVTFDLSAEELITIAESVRVLE